VSILGLTKAIITENIDEDGHSEALDARGSCAHAIKAGRCLSQMPRNEQNRGLKKAKIMWVCYPWILHRGRSFVHLSGSERTERLGHLARDGYDVYLIAADFQKEYYQRDWNIHLISIPIRYVPIISLVLYGLTLFFFLPFYLVKIRPDFVITDPSPTLFLTWKPFLSRLLRFKMILDIRSTPVNPYRISGFFSNIYFKMSVCIAKMMLDGMTIVTPMMRNEICQAFNISPSWTGILSNGISEIFLASYKKQNLDKVELRRKLGLSGEFTILYHGTLRVPTGGLIECIEAISLVKNDCPDAFLLLLGFGTAAMLHRLETTIKEKAVQDRVKLLGPVDFHDVPKYISMCNLGLVPLPNTPTWRYQQPLKLLEYMAMGKTVIVSDSPAHRSLIGNNRNGIYISHVNPVELAKAIKYAYNNRDRLDKWGEVGREIVEKKFTWERVNEDLIEYLLKARHD